MAAEVKKVADPVVGGEETLRLADWLELLHLPFSSSRRLVRVLHPVLVRRAPEPVLHARDRQHHLVEVPLVASNRQPAADLVGKHLPKLQCPLAYGLLADDDTARGQHLIDHPQAQREAEIEPNCVADDLRREAIPGVTPARSYGHSARLLWHQHTSQANHHQVDGAGKNTLREAVIDYGSMGACIDLVGTPDTVAGQMAEAMQEVGGDGFLIALPNVSRRSVAEVTDGLVPALQRRGLVRKQYEHAHFRDNLLAF